jgi:hypothetical protein
MDQIPQNPMENRIPTAGATKEPLSTSNSRDAQNVAQSNDLVPKKGIEVAPLILSETTNTNDNKSDNKSQKIVEPGSDDVNKSNQTANFPTPVGQIIEIPQAYEPKQHKKPINQQWEGKQLYDVPDLKIPSESFFKQAVHLPDKREVIQGNTIIVY